MRTILALAIIAFSNMANAQAYSLNESSLRSHEATLVPSSSRFELVQSHIAARNTFRLDKYTGTVYQIVQNPDGDLYCKELKRNTHPMDVVEDGKVNYQIFTSGIAVRFTFLMNVNTGATWQLTQDTKTEILYWSPLK